MPAATVRSSSSRSASAATSGAARTRRGLDEFDEGEAADAEIVVLARVAGAGQRLVVAAESVVQDGRHVAPTDRSPVPRPALVAFGNAQAKWLSAFASSPRHATSRTRGVPQAARSRLRR